jgi:phenylalanyl-tRNA synthetase beta chain
MKISYNWLQDLVEVKQAPRELATTLTMAGLAVDAVEAVGDDHILEFDLTSNRPDGLSHLGIAREVAVLTGVGLRQPVAEIRPASERTGALTTVEIQSPEHCPRYTARLIRGVKIGPSPEWLVRRLEALGQRSVNNVADITNYVMLETGQPLHAFDFDRLRGRRIIVRAAAAGERMTTLDGEERELTPETLVIADAERAVAIGGIKGGEDSGIGPTTVDVLLEAAWFTPAQIRQTSKRLGLSTEASYRFERGTDPGIVSYASDRASALIAEIAGGEILDEMIDLYPGRESIAAAFRPIPFRVARYEALTGLKVEPDVAARILTALGCRVVEGATPGTLEVVSPSWRIDIRIEEDLIEEVARVAGYDLLQTSLPGSAGAGAYLQGEADRRTVRRLFTDGGFHEAVSFSFVNAALDEQYSLAPAASRLELQDPIDETQSHMRTTLLGGLLRAFEHNFNHGTRHVRLFEIGKCFEAGAETRPTEIERLALVATGARREFDWEDAAARFDFYDLKGLLEALSDQLALPPLRFVPEAEIPWLHPGRAARLETATGQVLGAFGQLHPRLAAGYKIRQPILLGEFDFQALLSLDRVESRYHHLPKFPTVVRDLAVVVETSVTWQAIEDAILGLGLPNLVDVHLFDIYQGKELPAGKHSVALSIRYRAADRTLTDEEIAAAQEQLLGGLAAQFQAERR